MSFFKSFYINGEDVLVVKDQDGDGAPLIFVMMETPCGGTIRVNHIYNDDTDGWGTRDSKFEEKAQDLAEATLLAVNKLTKEQEDHLAENPSIKL